MSIRGRSQRSNRSNCPTFIYDAAGNLTNDGTYTYTYDAENRLSQISGLKSATYAYDAEGRRSQKITNGVSTIYLYDPWSKVIGELDGGCGATCWNTGYVYMGSQIVAKYSNGTTYFVHPDHLGSTRLVTNVSGGVYDSLDFLPFGEQIAGDTSITHKFTGYERDSESGKDNAEARYYASQYGRFMSPDPANSGAIVESPQTWNMYSYVANNPLNAADPNGLDCIYTSGVGTTEGQTGNNSQPYWVAGDCLSPTDNGYFVDGTVNRSSLTYGDGQLGYSFSNEEEGTGGGGVFYIGDSSAASTLPSVYIDSSLFFTPSDVPAGRSLAQLTNGDYMKAIHDSLVFTPEVCSVGVTARAGAGKVSLGADLNSKDGLNFATRSALPAVGPVTVAATTRGQDLSTSVSARIPDTPLSVGAGSRDGFKTISSVNVGLRLGKYGNAQAYANLNNSYNCH